jgi:hypothetical protein
MATRKNAGSRPIPEETANSLLTPEDEDNLSNYPPEMRDMARKIMITERQKAINKTKHITTDR